MYGSRDQSTICKSPFQEMVFNKPKTDLWFVIFLAFLAKQGIETNRRGLFETKWVAGGKTNPRRIWVLTPIDVSRGLFYGLQLSIICSQSKLGRGLEAHRHRRWALETNAHGRWRQNQSVLCKKQIGPHFKTIFFI